MQASHKVHPAGPARQPPPDPVAFLARSTLAQTSSSLNESSCPREQQRKWRKTLHQPPGVAMKYSYHVDIQAPSKRLRADDYNIRTTKNIKSYQKPDTSMKRLEHDLKAIHCLIPCFMRVAVGPLYLIRPICQWRDLYVTTISSRLSETLATSAALSATSCSPSDFSV